MQKKDVQPFIKSTTKNVIYKINFLTGTSVKQICEDLCSHALSNKEKLVDELSSYIKREIKINDTIYTPRSKPIKQYPLSGGLERVTIKLNSSSFEFAYSLAHSLGWSAAKVVAYCIEQSMNDFDYLNSYILKYLDSNLDENRREMIKIIIGDINKELNEEHTVTSLLLGIVEELKVPEQSFTEAVNHLVDSW